MIYAVYGLRLRGDSELRYIGQTCRTLDARLLGHMRAGANCPAAVPFYKWLLGNDINVEIFEIAHFDTRDEAKRVERETIGAIIGGHRLFNLHHVPATMRIKRPAFGGGLAA